jgi:hypothetical protein
MGEQAGIPEEGQRHQLRAGVLLSMAHAALG